MVTEVERHKVFVKEMRKNMTDFKINAKITYAVYAQTEDVDYDEWRLGIKRKFDKFFGPLDDD